MPNASKLARAARTIGPAVVGKFNERQVLRLIQARGQLSRAEVARETGLSAPTASKAVASLLKAGLLEETEAQESARGRPAPRLRLAADSAQVLGVVIDAGHCEAAAAGLDGKIRGDALAIPTPQTYAGLIDALETAARKLTKPGVATFGLGVSMPGLVDYRQGRGVLSPNVPITNGHSPGQDLESRLGVECALVQESHALCLAERHHGLAQGLDDFAVLDISTGLGLGVMLAGRLLRGHSGLAGEIGHITAVAEGGRKCGCGNTGCLETLASDSALAWHASRKLGRTVAVDEVIALARAGAVDLRPELAAVAGCLAIAVAAVINLFNPAEVFLHSPLFDLDVELLGRVVEATRRRSLPPSYAECRIRRAVGSKLQGAIAAGVGRVMDAVAPEMG